jgi:hypothetical protein
VATQNCAHWQTGITSMLVDFVLHDIAEIRFSFVTFRDFAIIIENDCGKISEMVKSLI